MFQLIKGASIRNAETLKEGYRVEENWIIANVSQENILKVMYHFLDLYDKDAYFLFLHVPVLEERERNLNKGNIETFHDDVYYLDGCTVDEMKELLFIYGEIFVQDGLSTFGIGNHMKKTEIGKYKYNELHIYAKENQKQYFSLFDDEGILYDEHLQSPWDLFSKENPGECRLYEDKNGKSIYDVVEELKKKGLYLYEQRESD